MALVKRFVSIILFYKHTLRACDVMEVAMRAPNYKSKVSALTSVYKNLKVASAQVMGSRFFNAIYEDLIERLLIFEEHMSKDFIVDSSPEFEYNDPRFFNLTASSLDTDEKILDYVVWLVRRDLFDRLKGYYPEIESLDDLDLANECYHASFLVKGIFSQLGISSDVIKIPAAFTDDIQLYDGAGYHYFTVVHLNKGEYLVDCTYRQFFRIDRNLLERLGVVGVAGCDPGAYMTQTNERNDVATQILKKGWILATRSNVKCYLDGFALANRNGLFYEKNGISDYTTPYTYDDYVKFLNEDVSQLDYEEFECLGTQRKPLANPTFCFKLKK